VCAVHDFEEVLTYFVEHHCDLFKNVHEEHVSYKDMLENLVEELTTLCVNFAEETGWKVVQTHRPRDKAVAPRKKTVLEELDSTDDECEEYAGPTAAGPSAAGPSAAAMTGSPEQSATMTQRVIAEHVREFVNERLQVGRRGRRIKDGLAWWSTNHARWPMVAAVAQHSLCVPASSGSSERGFSRTGHLVRARRASLSDEMIEQLSHLSNNPDI
jgi:hypothetical protein